MAFTLGELTLCSHDHHPKWMIEEMTGQPREGRFFGVEGLSRIDDRKHGQLIVIENVRVYGYTSEVTIESDIATLKGYVGKTTARNKLLTVTRNGGNTLTRSNCTLDRVFQEMPVRAYRDGTPGTDKWETMLTFAFVRLVNS